MVVDATVTADFPRTDKVFPRETVAWTRHVLGGNFHGTEFVEFIVFDVLNYSQIIMEYGLFL